MGCLRKLRYLSFFLLPTLLWAQSGTTQPSTDKSSAETNAPKLASATESASGSSSQRTAPNSGDSTKLEPIKIQKATYPEEAGEKGIQGQVWMKLLISETGDVENVEVISGDPVLAKAAVDAAKKWKFKPFIRNGKPMKVSTKMPLDFAFSDKISDTATTVSGNNSSASKRVRISQTLSQGLVVHKVQPIYPEEARRDHIQGTVLMRAEIDKDGRISQLTPISGPKELVAAALGAVQQWRYKPYMLNNEAVDVETQITVNFQLRAF